ncbi:energy-coupling factor transporter transmembrane component T [Mycoplasma wenyonii]|uniref:energy-coupling factor transporter transmembrane component T n=1 Tax=Mycoplasma wenyonii TaxID=65123 RepID=UPI0021ABA716|nr:energy-coupling factor transporter transmembrane component T [Mycoplasma wenyonii]
MYVGIYLFLFTVNWIFNKNPGFWDKNYLTSAYSDLGSISPFSFRGRQNSSSSGNGTSNIEVGWQLGGEVVKHCSAKTGTGCCKCAKGSGGSEIFSANSVEELKKACECAQQNKADCCKDTTGINCCTLKNHLKGLKTFYVTSASGKKIAGFIPKWYTVTLFQFLLAFNMSNKLVMMIALSSALSHTTDLTSFTFAIGQLIRPLKFLKIPVKEITLVISLAIRFIPSLLVETLRIVKAQSSRGIDFKNGRLRDKASAFLSLFIPLFIISMIKSRELANAMISRAYLPKAGRTSYRTYSINYLSLGLFGATIVFITICFYFVFSSSYISCFGPIDPLLLVAT